MQKQSFALEKGGPKRLELSWSGIWKNFTIRLDGNQIGSIASKKELKAGREFLLEDGSTLRVQLIEKFFVALELQVLRNGQPLPDSASDPVQRLSNAYGTIFFIGGLSILLGLVAEIFQVEFLLQIGIGMGSIIFGSIFLGLGFLVKRMSRLALAAAVVLFVISSLLSIASIPESSNPPVGSFIPRIFLMVPMLQGFSAIRALKKESKAIR